MCISSDSAQQEIYRSTKEIHGETGLIDSGSDLRLKTQAIEQADLSDFSFLDSFLRCGKIIHFGVACGQHGAAAPPPPSQRALRLVW